MEFSNIENIYIIFQWESFQQHLQFTSLNVEVLFEVWAETSDIHGGDGDDDQLRHNIDDDDGDNVVVMMIITSLVIKNVKNVVFNALLYIMILSERID